MRKPKSVKILHRTSLRRYPKYLACNICARYWSSGISISHHGKQVNSLCGRCHCYLQNIARTHLKDERTTATVTHAFATFKLDNKKALLFELPWDLIVKVATRPLWLGIRECYPKPLELTPRSTDSHSQFNSTWDLRPWLNYGHIKRRKLYG